MKSPPDLSDAEMKFARAKLHSDELLTNIWAWTHDETDPAIRVGIEDDLMRRRNLAYVESVKPIPDDWSLILGDALNDYRSALNYVAGALVLAGTRPSVFDDPRSQFQFPVCETRRRDFFEPRGNVRMRQLPGVPVKYLRVLSPFQPYRRVRRKWVLPALKRLNDLDKHRKPALATHHVAFQVSVMSTGYGSTPPVARWQTARPRGRVQAGAKLGQFVWLTDDQPIILTPPWGPSPGKPDVTVRFQSAPAVVLEDLQPDRTVVVRDFIDRTNVLIEEVLRKVREV